MYHASGAPGSSWVSYIQRNALTLLAWALSFALILFVVVPILTVFLGLNGEMLADTLTQAEILRSLGLTFGAGLIATVLAAVAAIPLGYLLARESFRGKALVEAAVSLPVVIPHTAAGVALLMVFGRRGLAGEPLSQVGLFFTDSLPGIVVAMLFVGAPFLINASRESFALIDPRLENLARTLGCSRWRAFWRVTLPLSWPGILSGGLMMWARGVSEFGAIAILAYNPKTVSVVIFERFVGTGLDSALPVTALLICCSLLLFILLRFLSGKFRHAP